MPDGPRKASLRAPTTMERIRSGLQDTLGIPESVWGMALPDQAIEARRDLQDATAAKGPVMRAPTTLERIRDTLQPVTDVVNAIGSPLENAEIGPAKAITLVTKKPLTELLRRLHPRNAQGMLVDPDEYPNITDAVQAAVERYPRAASHLNSIDTTLQGSDLGRFVVPNQFTKQIQSMGAERFRNTWGAPVAKIELNPNIEHMFNASMDPEAANTVFHEFGHLGQYIADPRRFDGAYDVSRKSLNMNADAASRFVYGDVGYRFNPAEVAARAIGRRGAQRMANIAPAPYRQAIHEEAFPGATPELFSDAWSRARAAWVKLMEQQGVPIKPRF